MEIRIRDARQASLTEETVQVKTQIQERPGYGGRKEIKEKLSPTDVNGSFSQLHQWLRGI